MNSMTSFLSTTLFALSTIVVFMLGALLLLTYVLVSAVVAVLRWCRAIWLRVPMHRRQAAAVSAASR